MQPRSIVIFTGTRADWGILSPLAKALQQRNDCIVSVLATNTHYCAEYGNTVNEIVADGFAPKRLAFDAEAEGADRVRQMGILMGEAADWLQREKPDIAVILGDRFEMLACAVACMMSRVPVVHIGGGAVSFGAIDDSIRHAITKMASIHLVETEEYKQRITAMGEHPDRVFVTGALGLQQFGEQDTLDSGQLKRLTGLDIDAKTLLVTFHPATLDEVLPAERARQLIRALQHVMQQDPEVKILFTASNNDLDGKILNTMWQQFVSEHPGRSAFVPSLGHRGYISTLLKAGAVVGNSSSGLVEVPSAGICTVDIGCRQRGRTAGPSVLHAESPKEIADAVFRALATPRGLKHNPYFQPDSLHTMVHVITSTPLDNLCAKTFYQA